MAMSLLNKVKTPVRLLNIRIRGNYNNNVSRNLSSNVCMNMFNSTEYNTRYYLDDN